MNLCRTLLNLLAAVDLGHFLLNELVALLADLDDLLAGYAEVLDSSQNPLRDFGSGLVLGQGVGVVKGVV